MSNAWKTIGVIVCYGLIVMSFGALLYDPLILLPLPVIPMLVVLRKYAKISRTRVWFMSSLIACSFALFIGCTWAWSRKTPFLMALEVKTACSHLAGMYDIYQEHGHDWRFACSEAVKKREGTILRQTSLLTAAPETLTVAGEGRKPEPVAVYVADSDFTSKVQFVILFADGTVKVYSGMPE